MAEFHTIHNVKSTDWVDVGDIIYDMIWGKINR